MAPPFQRYPDGLSQYVCHLHNLQPNQRSCQCPNCRAPQAGPRQFAGRPRQRQHQGAFGGNGGANTPVWSAVRELKQRVGRHDCSIKELEICDTHNDRRIQDLTKEVVATLSLALDTGKKVDLSLLDHKSLKSSLDDQRLTDYLTANNRLLRMYGPKDPPPKASQLLVAAKIVSVIGFGVAACYAIRRYLSR